MSLIGHSVGDGDVSFFDNSADDSRLESLLNSKSSSDKKGEKKLGKYDDESKMEKISEHSEETDQRSVFKRVSPGMRNTSPNRVSKENHYKDEL
jgi:hypothetical protein